MDSILDPKTAIQTAKLISFPAAFLVAGYNLSFAQNVLPAIYEHRPQFSATTFSRIWTGASPVIPTLTVVSTSAYAYLAYAIPEERSAWLKAAVAMFITVPYTGLVMFPGVKRLEEISKNKETMLKSEQNLEHRQLLVKWVKQNYVAVALEVASAVFGLRAAMNV